MDLLNEVEGRFPVAQWMIDGIHIWPLVRLELATDLTNASMYPALYHSVRSVSKARRLTTLFLREVSGLLRFCLCLPERFSKNAKPRRAEVVFLSDGISFSYLIDSWYEKFCDPLISELEEHRIPLLLNDTFSRIFYTATNAFYVYSTLPG